MAVVIYIKKENNNGEYSCGDIGISKEEWISILDNPKVQQYLEVLYSFLREQYHKSSCGQLSQKYGKSPHFYNSKITNFSKWVAKHLGRFNIVDSKGEPTFWPVAMEKGWKEPSGFIWQLRSELVYALQCKLMRNLIDEYNTLCLSSKPFRGYEETYKWALLDKCEGKEPNDIAVLLKGQSIVYSTNTDSVFRTLVKNKPEELSCCLNELFDEQIELAERIGNYNAKMRQICPSEFGDCANDERTAAALLTCKYPEKYTFYKYEIYAAICKYFGIEIAESGHKFVHFIKIINEITERYGDEVQDLMYNEIKSFHNKPQNLAIQTLLWCMKENIKNKSNMKTKFTWIPFYKEFSEKLLQFKNNRKQLLDMIYANRDDLMANSLHEEGGRHDLCEDVDPFTVLGIVNKRMLDQKRYKAMSVFKKQLNIESEIPHDLLGLPVLNPLKANFFSFRKLRKDDDIQNLWDLFEKVVEGKDCEVEYNKVVKQRLIKINITMGLFWISPNDYLAYDSTNRKYLANEYSIYLPDKAPTYREYISTLNDIKDKMISNRIKEKTFYELSAGGFESAETNESSKDGTWYAEIVDLWKNRKNLVLYGAPGTSKTYDVPEFAVRLCCPESEPWNMDREEIMEQYKVLKEDKRVMFTTFHQSMDYEDWIEGLRPVVDENEHLTYSIEKGIFKKLCDEAEMPIINDKEVEIDSNAVIWKVSLGGAGDNSIRAECMRNGHIRIGWEGYGPEINDETDWSAHKGSGKQILDSFVNKMNIGDIVLSCFNKRTIDAIGVITGDYEWKDDYRTFNRVRSVKWLVKGLSEDIVKINDGKTMTTGTIYRLNNISLDNVKAILDKYQQAKTMTENTKPYVMVIDELNRGNVSKIFGELITLLEADKRKGCKNEENVILPYSKKSFSIPSNVYIIATMNTADRSLGSLDYAIRRRFAFVCEKPYELGRNGYSLWSMSKGTNLKTVAKRYMIRLKIVPLQHETAKRYK